jgi:hypothetical protein
LKKLPHPVGDLQEFITTHPRGKDITRWDVFPVPPIGKWSVALLGISWSRPFNHRVLLRVVTNPGVTKMGAALFSRRSTSAVVI